MKTQLVSTFLVVLVLVLWLPAGAFGQGAPLFVIKGEPSEISGTSNNAIVTPTVRPGSYTGVLKLTGTGSVNFTPATVGNGVYFQTCCSTNAAYYQFTGSTLGSIFNTAGGEISFYLTSRQSYAQRQSGSFRTVFGVEDASGDFLFSFITVAGGFGYRLASSPTTFYNFPSGQQDSLFGLGVTMKVRMTWDGAFRRLYLNDTLQQTTAYSSVIPNWTTDSLFLFGAADIGTGGVNVSDDVIDEFTVGPLVKDAGPPTVSVTFPTAGSTVSGNVTLQASASDDIGVVGVKFQVDGADFSIEDFASPYSASWNTAIYANGQHMITAIARDAAGNSTTSNGVSVTVFNAPDTTPPVLSNVSAINIGPNSATISWTTDEASDSQVVYGLTSSYGSASALNSLAVLNHTVTLTGLTPSTTYHYQAKSRDIAGNPGVSADLTFRTAVAGTTGDVNWTNMPHTPGWPGFDGWLTMWYDAISKNTVFYVVVPGSQSIYSTDIYFYGAANNLFQHLGGTGSLADSCPPDTPTQPGDRHPQWQMTVDTRRNRFWMMGGSNAACRATRQDMYYLDLQANPLSDSWHQVAPPHLPLANISSAIVYDADSDALVAFGTDGGAQTHDHWVYCPSDLNPTPGRVTARQSAVGCTSADDWVEVTPFNGKVTTDGTRSVTRASGDGFVPGWTNINISGALYNVVSVADSDHLTLDRNAAPQTAVPFYVQPPGNTFTGMLYDTATKKMIQFGGQTGASDPRNETWAYDVLARKWKQVALTSTPPPTGPSVTNQPAMAYNSLTHKLYFHQTTGAGYPADWLYDPAVDTWTKLASVGTGAVSESALSYDPGRNVLIGWAIGQVGGPDVWQGQLPTITGDTTAPVVSITSPATGASVSGNIAIGVDASDASGIAGVQLQVDGVNAGGEDAVAPYTLSWDSASVANGNHTLTVVARDKANNTRVSQAITLSINNSSDITPPTRSNGAPIGTLPSGTSATTMSLNTNEAASCRFSKTPPGTDFSSMDLFKYTGGTTHYTTAGPLTGGTYVYYVRCVDIRGNTNPDDYTITFSISSSDTTPPVRSNGAPAGNLATGTTSTTLSLTTNENATCRYSQTANTAYASMTGVFTTTGGTAHQTVVSPLANGAVVQLLREMRRHHGQYESGRLRDQLYGGGLGYDRAGDHERRSGKSAADLGGDRVEHQ